jgi:hypothetical protein
MMKAFHMALPWKESPWMQHYRAASKRRRPLIWRRLSALADELREPLDAAVVLGVIFAAAVVLACVFPI